MRIGLWQLKCVSGDFDGNLAKLVRGLEQAQKERVEIVCFPECYLTGYQDDEAIVRKHAFVADSPQFMKLLDKTSRFDPTVIVGFFELRGGDIYNTAAVIHKGHVLGLYRKCTAFMPFEKQGREFPVFERNGVKFGVVICSDGGYIEPTRILALKGAKIVFAPHYNSITGKGVLGHFMHVRADHIARATENMVWFVRANSVAPGKDTGITKYDGVNYGDSYIVDPFGEILIRSKRHKEDFLFADVDASQVDRNWKLGRSRWSFREFGKLMMEAMDETK